MNDSQINASQLFDEKVLETHEQVHESTPLIKRKLNPIAIVYILILLISLLTWFIFTILALFNNKDERFPIPVFGVPFLILLCSPPAISLILILFRTFYTLTFPDDTESLEPLDLARNESQRQLLLLPLSVSGFVMTILPAYYFKYALYLPILGCQALIGFMMLFLFLGIALIPESPNIKKTFSHRLFMTVLEK